MRRILLLLSLLAAVPVLAVETTTEVILQNGVGATGNGTTALVGSYSSIGLDVQISDTATVIFEGRPTNTSTFRTFQCMNKTTGAGVSQVTASTLVQCDVAGFAEFRARVSAWTAGTVTVYSRLSTASVGGGGGGAAAGGDGAINDGADSNIKATVKDYTNSNPIAAVIVDTNGDVASIGGGTQYTEDAAAAANPVGNMQICRRRDTLSGETTTDGDNVAANCTDKGEVYVKHVDAVPVTDNGGSLTVDGTVSISGSVTVTDGSGALNTIVDSGTITTITNPVTVTDGSGALNVIVDSSALPTGAATAAKQPALGTAGTASTDVITVQGIASMTPLDVACSNCSGSGVTHNDDAAFTPATDDVVPIAGFFNDVAPDSVHEGDAGAVRMSGNRNLYTTIRDSAGNERGLNVDANGEIGIGAIRSALPAGTNAIGKLAANSGVDIGDVDVTSVIAGTGATNLGKAEDAGHTTGDTGVMALCVRQSSATDLSAGGTNGDYEPCQVDANGKLYTNADTEMPAAASLADDTANPTVPGVAGFGMVWDGSTWDRAPKPTAGAGSTDSTTQRVVIAYDSGVCNAKDTAQVAVAVSSSGNNELVALTSNQTIYVCNVLLVASGTVAVQLIYGTGSACATGETDMTGPMDLTAQVGFATDFQGRLKTAQSNALCIELSGNVAVNGVITYRKAATF